MINQVELACIIKYCLRIKIEIGLLIQLSDSKSSTVQLYPCVSKRKKRERKEKQSAGDVEIEIEIETLKDVIVYIYRHFHLSVVAVMA